MSAMAARTAIPAVAGHMVVARWPVTPDHVARAQFMELCARIANSTEPCAKLVREIFFFVIDTKYPLCLIFINYEIGRASCRERV